MKDINLFDQLIGLYQVGSASAWRGEALKKTGADRFLVHAKRRHRWAQWPALLDTELALSSSFRPMYLQQSEMEINTKLLSRGTHGQPP